MYFSAKKIKDIQVNILTRTSRRPVGFNNCRQSVKRQTYKSINHFVSYEDEKDLVYLDLDGIKKVKVDKYRGNVKINPEGYLHAPYNLYCNKLLEKVENGWIMFLDDDDHLLHNKAIQELVYEIDKANEDTLFIWQIRYPDGRLLPTKYHIESQKIELEKIDSTCFMFHSKYKEAVQWDEWKASDYRVIKQLSNIIPNQKWIEKVYIQINNYGDLGHRNDIVKEQVINKLIFNKNWFWFLIPKYHTKIHGRYVFQLKTYKSYWRRAIKKLKKMFNTTSCLC